MYSGVEQEDDAKDKAWSDALKLHERPVHLVARRHKVDPFTPWALRGRLRTTHEDRMSSDLGKEGGYEETNNADHVVAARPHGLRVLCDAARAHKSYYYRCEARSGLSMSVRNWWHT